MEQALPGLGGGATECCKLLTQWGQARTQPRVKSWEVGIRGSSSDLRAHHKLRAKTKKERREGSGRGLGEPLPQNFWNFELPIAQSGVFET